MIVEGLTRLVKMDIGYEEVRCCVNMEYVEFVSEDFECSKFNHVDGPFIQVGFSSGTAINILGNVDEFMEEIDNQRLNMKESA